MNILIVGCGRVGRRLVHVLERLGHDVSVLDEDAANLALLNELESPFSGMAVAGVPIDGDVLRSAGIEACDAVAAVTKDDNINLMVAQIARELFGVKHVIARVAEPSRKEVYTERFGLRIVCGKGTYVRVLLEDIGRALGVPATMAALRRTAAAGYTEAQAVNFAQVEEAKAQGTLASLMLSVETVFCALPQLTVDEAAAQRLLNGAAVYRCKAADGRWRLHGPQGFLGTGCVQGGVLKAEKLFVER